jgi:erythromycin esterase-like protein
MKLMESIKEKKIIGLGETTHGQLKINEFRNRLIKGLITKYNFSVIAIEDEYSCVKRVNKYIKNKSDNFEDGLSAFPFLNKTFISLIEWIRKYNKENGNKVSIIGFDCQETCSKVESKLDKKVDNLVKRLKKIPYTEGIRRINFRDKCMYDIFMDQYNEDEKYIIIGHNGHIQRESYDDKIKWFGNYLDREFGDKYCAIGNTFYSGKYLGKDIDNKYRIGIAYINEKRGKRNGVYKIKGGENIVMYEGDLFFSSKNPNKTFEKMLTNDRFDILVVINNEEPFMSII